MNNVNWHTGNDVCLYIMIRTQIYLSEAQQQRLGALARERRTTASALIREAVDGYLEQQLTPQERVDALRAFARRVPVTPSYVSDSAAFVDNLRAADADRLRSLG